MEEQLLRIINHYGLNNQQRKLAEEVFELQESMTKYEYSPIADKYDIEEELADVMVMLEQFRLYYDIPSMTITEIMQQKIERQLKRIEEGK